MEISTRRSVSCECVCAVCCVLFQALFSCSKLINRSVPNTVDMRVLTRIPPSAGAAQRREALEENMTLVVESGRAIGCRVDSDDLGERLLEKDPHTIRSFLVDLIRVSQHPPARTSCLSP